MQFGRTVAGELHRKSNKAASPLPHDAPVGDVARDAFDALHGERPLLCHIVPAEAQLREAADFDTWQSRLSTDLLQRAWH